MEISMSTPRKTPAGTWRIKVERAGYKTVTKTFKTKDLANRWARGIESAFDKGAQPIDNKAARGITVSELFERYVKDCTVLCDDGKPKIECSKSNLNTLKRVLRNAQFMTRRLNQIQAKDIADWRELRLTQVQPVSVDREFSVISSVFKRAQKVWLVPIAGNPARETTRPEYKKVSRKKGWKPDQIDAVCNIFSYKEGVYPESAKFLNGAAFDRNTGYRQCKPAFFAYAFLVALETAMRQGEIASLTVADFDREGGYVHLRKTKNGDSRLVALNEKAYDLIALLCEGFPPEHKIFKYGGGTICCYFIKARRAAKIHGLTFHDSRHEAITRMVPMFRNVLELAAHTGHRKLQSLDGYYNPDIQTIRSRLLGKGDSFKEPDWKIPSHLPVVEV
jgi:integrase